MLIYDHTKTLIGIDDDDLHLLGFISAEELFGACTDIADFFIKQPGYIHNFKNFQWIDFVLHAESQNSRAIVDTGRKHFSCELLIKPFHLLQSPDREAYAVYLQHVQPLKTGETPKAPTVTPPPPPPVPETAAPKPVTEAAAELPKFDDVEETTLGDSAAFEMPSADLLSEPFEAPVEEELRPEFAKPLEIEEDLFITEEPAPHADIEAAIEALPPQPAEAAPMYGDYLSPEEQGYIHPLEEFDDYVFDPHIAADELGLPVDLIEEFIGDFINQSHDFHDPMFEAAEQGDYENLKLLSHKLKGVAANLRIEDAFAMLSTINTSHTRAEVSAYLKMFYNTIAKLEGKEPLWVTYARGETVTESEPAETEPVLPEAESLPEAEPESAGVEEDLYAFDVKMTPTEAAPAAKTAEADTDIYNFDVKEVTETEPAAPEAPWEPEVDEDLYAFEISERKPAADTATELPEPAEHEPEEPALYDFEPERFEPPLQYEETAEAELSESADVDMEAAHEPEVPVMDITSAETAPEPAAPAVPRYDVAGVANELGLPADIVEDLKNDFIAHANLCRAQLDDAIDSVQPAQWRNQAIQLKGIADNLRMNDIAQLMQRLEAATDPLDARALTDQFYTLLAQL